METGSSAGGLNLLLLPYRCCVIPSGINYFLQLSTKIIISLRGIERVIKSVSRRILFFKKIGNLIVNPEGVTQNLLTGKHIFMPGTFSQLYIQIVFAVKGRRNLIAKEWKAELNKYIAGIISGKQQKPIIVNGMPDHIHIFNEKYIFD